MNTDRMLSRSRVIVALNATEVLAQALPNGLLADKALDTLNLALDNIENPSVRRLLAAKAEQAGHDLSTRRAAP